MGPLPGQPAAKNWEDSNTVRLGLTQGIGESVKVMVGLAYDESPVPDETLGFELPDSDAFIGSVGVRWAMSEELDVGAALLYDKKKDRSVTNDTIDGKFSGSSATILSVGLGYKF
jgi:long-chain fatty acid transport protein